MSKVKKWLVAAGFAVASLATGAEARADGLVIAPTDLAARERAALQEAIAEAKKADPEAFELVRNVEGYKPERYRKYRKAQPMVGRELKHLGARALMPMLEALAFEGWDRGAATDREWRALQEGLLFAVGELRDPRASAVLRASFDAVRHPRLRSAAARGMGTVCDDASLAQLQGNLKGDLRPFAIEGLGACMRLPAVESLAVALDATASASEAATIARALGHASSSWAWKALAKKQGKAVAKEGRAVREAASRAAARAFLRFDGGKARAAFTFAMSMAALPDLRALVAPIRAQAAGATQRDLDRVVDRVERRTRRAR